MAQADTVVPGGVQGYDRYAYLNNAPVDNTDPTGHHCADEDSNGLCPGDAGYDDGSSSGGGNSGSGGGSTANSKNDTSSCAGTEDGTVCKIYISSDGLSSAKDLVDLMSIVGAVADYTIGVGAGALFGFAGGAIVGAPEVEGLGSVPVIGAAVGAFLGGFVAAGLNKYDDNIQNDIKTEMDTAVSSGGPLIIANTKGTFGLAVDGGNDGIGVKANTVGPLLEAEALTFVSTGQFILPWGK